MQDLEIRGSGALFGHKQSGHISSVGFQLYCDLLNVEIQKKRSSEKTACFQPQINTRIPISIEEGYVENMSMRVDYYYRIGRAIKLEELSKIEKSLVDVFGPIPKPTKNLIYVAKVRILYTETPVLELDIQSSSVGFLVGKVDKQKELDFLSSVGRYEDKNLDHIQFKEVDSSALRIVLHLVKEGDLFGLLFSFVRLFTASSED